MKSVGNSYALVSSVRDLNGRGIHLRWSFSLSLFDQRGSSAESVMWSDRIGRHLHGLDGPFSLHIIEGGRIVQLFTMPLTKRLGYGHVARLPVLDLRSEEHTSELQSRQY